MTEIRLVLHGLGKGRTIPNDFYTRNRGSILRYICSVHGKHSRETRTIPFHCVFHVLWTQKLFCIILIATTERFVTDMHFRHPVKLMQRHQNDLNASSILRVRECKVNSIWIYIFVIEVPFCNKPSATTEIIQAKQERFHSVAYFTSYGRRRHYLLDISDVTLV